MLVGVLAYLAAGTGIDWTAAPALILGAMCCVPFSALAVKRMNPAAFTLVVGTGTLILGLVHPLQPALTAALFRLTTVTDHTRASVQTILSALVTASRSASKGLRLFESSGCRPR
jgi:uncharacterized membrane protein YfcA